ncbi:endonuclease/exonuclease/phosphatase family protein [Bifidobacterium amazonense]|uniref:Endonuclease/exonuclease/phosphatase family protein n=1 Tax=Bifidobacterium amazonense TaxID=2809027 RepID=A0ABS9VY69_9BIFI|nr:endonuclease/exonuclease/phosphatase family protein [Bifidobacterium amazonense]MCH9277065.1 endonuclease/exonuclease/phosphatase family protein [Bifidobacterium amazonense]
MVARTNGRTGNDGGSRRSTTHSGSASRPATGTRTTRVSRSTGAGRTSGGGRSGGTARRSGAGRPTGTGRSNGAGRSNRKTRASVPPSPSPARRIAGVLAWALAVTSLTGTLARMLPADLQALPYLPVLIAVTPWFALCAAIALAFALAGRRWIAALAAVACIVVQAWWQRPFLSLSSSLSPAAIAAVSGASANTRDAYARVMTCNVYKGRADAASIVKLVSEQRVEVLALQETTDEFVQALDEAGIRDYLPYSQVSTSDGVYGNGLWSATPLGDPADDDVNSSASFMPGGTVTFDGTDVRFVSVHTTSPTRGYWRQWKRSLDELGLMRSHGNVRYVFMGDFNATTDHASFRGFLGDRFSDAAQLAGHGFTFTWPADRFPLPRFAGIDHVVLDKGMTAGQMQVKRIPGSDHAALLATIAVG